MGYSTRNMNQKPRWTYHCPEVRGNAVPLHSTVPEQNEWEQVQTLKNHKAKRGPKSIQKIKQQLRQQKIRGKTTLNTIQETNNAPRHSLNGATWHMSRGVVGAPAEAGQDH